MKGENMKETIKMGGIDLPVLGEVTFSGTYDPYYNQIHLVMPFTRTFMINRLTADYLPMGIIWHPIMFKDQEVEFKGDWIKPVIIPENAPEHPHALDAITKINHFIRMHEFVDDDYYIQTTDDGMFEPNVFSAIKEMDDEVVIISLKRGDHIPPGVPAVRAYPTNTLFAHPDNVRIGEVSGDQVFIKGRIFKSYLWDNKSMVADGVMAMHMKEFHQVAYRPDLFSLFNYFEPGRYNGVTI